MSLSSMSSYLEFHEMHSDTVAGREAMRTTHKKHPAIGRAPSPVPEAWTNEIVWATQRGDYYRCLQLIKAGYDVKKCDTNNISLLHWASINGQGEIVKLYLDKGAIVDAVGGDLRSTPLQWATREGHLNIVILLMKHGADESLRDGEGRAAIHIAAHFGFAPIVAYLLANGVHPDTPDRNGMTPLMWAVRGGFHSVDTSRYLLGFGADASIQDRVKGNTALHLAIKMKNRIAVKLLVGRSDTNLDISNLRGVAPRRKLQKLAMKSTKITWILRCCANDILVKDEWRHRSSFQKQIHHWTAAALPFLLIYSLGTIFSAELVWPLKVTSLIAVYLMSRYARKVLRDENMKPVHTINVYLTLAATVWMHIVWARYIKDVVSLRESRIFAACSILMWYSFYRVWRADPGIITSSEEERNETIIELAEEDHLEPRYFCTTCLVKKPPHSRHCHVCHQCVDRFDHHCQWLGNCVGRRNHKHFVEYLFSVPLMCALFLHGSMGFLHANSGTELGFLSILSCEPWVTFMGLLAATGGCWVTVVLVVQLYRILWQGKTRTTREGFGTEVGSGSRPSLQPNPGVVRNFIDFFELDYLDCRPCSCFF